MSIYFSEIPEWLYDSEYYKSLYEDANKYDGVVEDFKIPVDYCPPESSVVDSFEKFKMMFFIHNRWGFEYATSFFEFIHNNKREVLKFLFYFEDSHTQAKFLLDYIFNDFSFNIIYLDRNQYNKCRFEINDEGLNIVFRVNISKRDFKEMINNIIKFLEDPDNPNYLDTKIFSHLNINIYCNYNMKLLDDNYVSDVNPSLALAFATHNDDFTLSLTKNKIQIILKELSSY